MLQNEDPFNSESSLMRKLRQDESDLQSEKKEYEKYQAYLNTEIDELFTKNEQLLSCFMSHKKIFEDLELQNRLLEEQYNKLLSEESRSKKIKARLYQLKTKQDPIFPSKVLIPMENNTENQHIILSKEYHDLESKISEINVDDISNLLEEKQKLEERHVKLQKEASELMALLIKPENKLSDETESLFYHMLSAMNECDKSRKKFFILKHGSQQQIDELKLNSEASKSEAINVIDLLNLFPDIEPSPNLQTLINEEMENKKRKEAKRKRIEAMKKKDEEFLRNLNHRQRSNYFQIRSPDEKKVSNPKESISDSGEKSKNDQINRLRSALNNQYAELKKSNPHPISLPNADDSVLPSNKKNGRRKINSNQIQKNNINDNQIQLDQIISTKSHKLIRKKRKKHSNQNTNSMFPKKIYSSEFASSSSTSAARKREENNLIYSLDQNKEENNLNHLLNQKTEENNQNHSLNESKEENKLNDSINHKKEENKLNDSINHKKEENKLNDSINYKKEENKLNDSINQNKDENNQIHSLDQNKDENSLNHLSDQSKEENINSDIDDNENKGDYSIRKSRKTIIINIGEQENDDDNNNKRKIYRIRKRRRKNDEDEGNYQLNIEEEESDSETANGNTFEFEQTLELDSRWRFHVSDNEKDQQKSPAKLQIGHNPRQFVEEESNKEDYSKTEFLQEIVSTIEEEEEEIEEDGEKFIEKVIIHKKRSKRRRKHQYHENDEKSKSIQKENELKDNQTIKDDNLNEQNNDDSDNPVKTKMHSSRRPSIIKIIDPDPIKKRRSNSAENENQESQKIHRRKRKSKHRSKSIDQHEEDQDEEESNISQKEETTSQKIIFKLEDKQEILKSDSSSSELNTKEIEENKTNKSDDDNNNDDNVKKPLKKIPMKKKRLLNLEIDKKPVIIDEQKSTIDNLGSRPHHSRSNDKNRHKQRRSSNSNDDNKSDKSNDKDNDKDNDYDYPSDKNYEYNIEYDYEFDDKDYYSNDNKHTKRRRHGHHYRRKTNRRFYTHHPRHHYQHHHHSNHHHNSRYNRYSKPKTKNESKSRKDYDYETPSIEEEAEDRKPKQQQQRSRNRSQKQEPRRTRRNNDYYSNSDSYSDSYLYSDNDYDYNDSNGYNSDSDGYEFEFEVQEEEVFAPLKLQISKDAFCHEEKEKIQRNPRVFQRKIIPKQPESDKKSLLSMSLKGDNDPSNHQIKESKTYTKLNTLNDFVIHEPNEAYESLRKKGRGEQLDLEIAKTREKLAKIENEIKELQKKLKSSLLKEATSQVDEPFSMQSLSSMKNEIKSNENIDDLIDQSRKQKELLDQELADKQNRLSELQKQYVRKTSTLRHYKQLKDELNEKNFFLINASKKQIKKLNDLDEQIRRGRRTIEIIDGRIADLKNIIDLKTKELSVKANKKRPNVVEMCSKFKKDRLSEKEILQLIDYHDIERQYLEKEIESISYQLSDDSLTKKGFEIERIVIIAKQLKEKYFQKRGMANQTMITITNEDDLNLLAKRKTLTKEEIHSTMMQIDLVISQIQKQISQLSNKNIEVPPTPSSFNNLQAIKKSKLESMTSLS